MKKVLASIAVAIYLVLTTGVMVNFHYCMNRLASTSLYQTSVKSCGRCGMDMHSSNDCCHDEVTIVKMQIDQQVSQAIHFELPPVAPLLPPMIAVEDHFSEASSPLVTANHSPPLLSDQQVYLRNCVFRI